MSPRASPQPSHPCVKQHGCTCCKGRHDGSAARDPTPPVAGRSVSGFLAATPSLDPRSQGRGQFPILLGTLSYQNTYFIFFSLYSHRFKVFFTRILRFVFSAAEYSRIHCILKNTHRIHTEYTTCKNAEKCSSRNTRDNQPTTSEIPDNQLMFRSSADGFSRFCRIRCIG